MELKNKLVVGLMSSMLAFTGLACAAEDTTDGGTDVEAPVEDMGTEEMMGTEDMTTEDMGTEDMGTEDMGTATP